MLSKLSFVKKAKYLRITINSNLDFNLDPGPIAKFFSYNEPVYAYPLFKTYKLNPEIIHDTGVADIPVRLLQSAGNITTFRTTAFSELILNPISKRFCKSQFNEFC